MFFFCVCCLLFSHDFGTPVFFFLPSFLPSFILLYHQSLHAAGTYALFGAPLSSRSSTVLPLPCCFHLADVLLLSPGWSVDVSTSPLRFTINMKCFFFSFPLQKVTPVRMPLLRLGFGFLPSSFFFILLLPSLSRLSFLPSSAHCSAGPHNIIINNSNNSSTGYSNREESKATQSLQLRGKVTVDLSPSLSL